MDHQSRAVLTRDKTRRGRLPSPVGHYAVENPGDGRLCDGCGERIDPAAKFFTVTPRRWLPLWLHFDCYRAWQMYFH
jgi:hypothetical protein